MKEIFLHFKSATPCLININGDNVGSIDNINTFEIDIISKCENIYVTYFPIAEKSNLMQYTFSINLKTQPSCNNENVLLVPFPNNNYDVIMKPFEINTNKSDLKVLVNQKIEDYFINIVSDTYTEIFIYSNISIVYKNRIPLINNCKVEKIKDNLILTGYIHTSLYYLLIIETKTFTEKYNNFSHAIESNDDVLQTLKKLNNIEHSAEITKIDLNNDNLEKYYVYEFDQPVYPNHELLLPRAFLEALQINDNTYLHSILSNKYLSTDLGKFNEFFGNYNEIYLNTHEYKKNKVNYTLKYANYFKNYNFIINNGKIEEIEENF